MPDAADASRVDAMAFSAYSDDIELGCGETLIELSDVGHSVVRVFRVFRCLTLEGEKDAYRDHLLSHARGKWCCGH